MLGVLPCHDMAEVDSIGCRCDSETIVASRIIGELKKDVWHTFGFVHDQLVWFGLGRCIRFLALHGSASLVLLGSHAMIVMRP